MARLLRSRLQPASGPSLTARAARGGVGAAGAIREFGQALTNGPFRVALVLSLIVHLALLLGLRGFETAPPRRQPVRLHFVREVPAPLPAGETPESPRRAATQRVPARAAVPGATASPAGIPSQQPASASAVPVPSRLAPPAAVAPTPLPAEAVPPPAPAPVEAPALSPEAPPPARPATRAESALEPEPARAAAAPVFPVAGEVAPKAPLREVADFPASSAAASGGLGATTGATGREEAGGALGHVAASAGQAGAAPLAGADAGNAGGSGGAVTAAGPSSAALTGTAVGGGPSPQEIAALRRRIDSRKVYPQIAIRNGWEGRVLVEMQLDLDGRLAAVRLVAGSGYSILDEATITAVRLASPFPPVARVVTVPVEYRLIP